MSVFYGSIQGNRGEATRGGSKASGFRASAQSFKGSVIVDLDYNDKEELVVRVGTNDYSSSGRDGNSPTFRGTFNEFKEALTLLNDIKNGKVSVTRHREKSNKQLALERAFR